MRLEYNMNVGPDDIRYRTEVQDFMQEYKDQDPIRNPPDAPMELPEEDEWNMLPEGRRDYHGEYPHLTEKLYPDINVDDSARFGNAPRQPTKY